MEGGFNEQKEIENNEIVDENNNKDYVEVSKENNNENNNENINEEKEDEKN